MSTTTTTTTTTHNQPFTLTLSTSHCPPFTLTPSPTKPTPSPSSRLTTTPTCPTSTPSRHINQEDISKSQSSRTIDKEGTMSMDRDRLSIDTFTSVIERDTVYSRASNVASILRSLGPSTLEREQGINALCNYIEGKKGKGKNEEEIRKKLNVLESMVPADLGEIFVKASLSSIRSSSQLPPPPVPPIKPAEESPRPDNSPITYTSPSFTFSFSPGSSSSSFAKGSNSNSVFEYDCSSSSSTPSSFSSPPPLTSPFSPYTSVPFTPYSPFIRGHALTTSSTSSLGRAPTLLSPLAIGGWGRSWERPSPSSNNNDNDDRSSSRQTMVFDGISLENFPNPPDHIPSSSNPCPEEEGKMDTHFEKHIFTREFLDTNRQSRFFHVDIDDTTHNLSPTKSTSHKLDQSWLSLSISDADDNSSEGLPSAGLPSSTQTSAGSGSGSEAFEWDRIIQSQLTMNMGMDDERTVTGIESSRWSAVISNVDEITSSQDRSELLKGPTEASLLRDAYLCSLQSMLHTPPPMVNLPGPEQGDSHTILMAYAQPTTA